LRCTNPLFVQLSGAVSILGDIERFSVSQNDIVGTIPAEIFESTSLKSIDFSNNAFFGEIPRFREDSVLETLNLESNNLSGSLQPNIENAKLLSSLRLASNALNGPLVSELFGLPLTELSIALNFMTGAIPDEIGEATLLTTLTLGPNKFSGDIPLTISSLTNLERLIIRDVPDLGGRLPASYGLALTNLVEFILSETNVRGNIPEFYGQMTKLEILDFSRNSIRGDLPSELGLLTSLSESFNRSSFVFAVDAFIC
jgi:Leucine-rich repeat (LRR) protein